jgi:hypothetical protein
MGDRSHATAARSFGRGDLGQRGNSRFLQMSFRDGIRRGEVEASFPLRQAKWTSFSSNGSRPIAVQKSIPKT